jgi:hypothetical protein
VPINPLDNEIEINDLYFYAHSIYYVDRIQSGRTVLLTDIKDHRNYSYITIEYLKQHQKFEPTGLDKILYNVE